VSSSGCGGERAIEVVQSGLADRIEVFGWNEFNTGLGNIDNGDGGCFADANFGRSRERNNGGGAWIRVEHRGGALVDSDSECLLGAHSEETAEREGEEDVVGDSTYRWPHGKERNAVEHAKEGEHEDSGGEIGDDADW